MKHPLSSLSVKSLNIWPQESEAPMTSASGGRPRPCARDALLQDFWSARPPSRITTLHDGRLTSDEILDAINSIESEFQPPHAYRLDFVRHIIKKLESTGDEEVLERWYDHLETLTDASPSQKEFYRIYNVGGCDEPVLVKIIEEEKAFVSQGSTGLITWNASLELAKWIGIQQMKNGNCEYSWVFELGCGTGLLSIAILQKFPFLLKALATDVHEGVLERCRANSEINRVKDKVVPIQLDWTRDEKMFTKYLKDIQTPNGAGVLLGADIFFDASMATFVGRIIERFIEMIPEGKAFFSCEIRNEDTFSEFQRCIESNSLVLEEVHSWKSAANGTQGTIVEVKRK